MVRRPGRRQVLQSALAAVLVLPASCSTQGPPPRRARPLGRGQDDAPSLTRLLRRERSGTVELVEGTYQLQSAVTVPEGVHLKGSGPATVLRVSGSSPDGAVLLGSGSTLSDLTIDGAEAARTTERDAVTADTGVVDPTVERVRVTAWHGNAVHFDASTRATVRAVDVDTVTRTGSSRQGSAVLLTSLGGDTVDPLVSGVTAQRCAGSAVQLEGDYDRADWRTSGYKVRSATVEGCVASRNTYAGVFLNSCVDSLVTDCTADDNGDYGVGLEFCVRSSIADCSTARNGTYGQALFESNTRCRIERGVAEGNRQHGYAHIQGSAVRAAPADGCAIVDVTARANEGSGVLVQDVVDTRVTGTALDNAVHGVSVVGGERCAITATARGNGGDGLHVAFTDDVEVEGGELSGNGGAGCGAEADGGNALEGLIVLGTVVDGNAGHGIDVRSSDVRGLVVREATLRRNGGWGCTVSSGTASGHRLQGCTVADNGLGGVSLRALRDGSLRGNRFEATTPVAVATTAMEVLDDRGFSGGPFTVEGNTARGHDTGLRISAGANTGPTAAVTVTGNDLSGCALPYDFVAMGAGAPVELHGEGPDAPTAPVAPGSTWVRSGRGAAVRYLKVSGVNTVSGWERD